MTANFPAERRAVEEESAEAGLVHDDRRVAVAYRSVEPCATTRPCVRAIVTTGAGERPVAWEPAGEMQPPAERDFSGREAIVARDGTAPIPGSRGPAACRTTAIVNKGAAC